MKKILLIVSLVSVNFLYAQNIAGINWLDEEPDGYFSWSEANKWCTDRGYRLPYMSELIAVWDANGGKISPSGFEKDTFYWAIEECSSEEGCHKACAMDYDCSKDDGGGWSDSGFGHPKCVISTDGTTSSSTETSINWGVESTSALTFNDAKAFCENEGQRLPSLDEAKEEFDANGLDSFVAEYFWTGDEYNNPNDTFHSGYIYTFGKKYGSGDTMWPDNNSIVYARCVIDGEVTIGENENEEETSTESTTTESSESTLKLSSSIIDELGEGWHLLGSSELLNDFGVFNSAKIVWFYDFDKGWQNFIPTQSTPPEIDIKNFQGFWVKK